MCIKWNFFYDLQKERKEITRNKVVNVLALEDEKEDDSIPDLDQLVPGQEEGDV